MLQCDTSGNRDIPVARSFRLFFARVSSIKTFSARHSWPCVPPCIRAEFETLGWLVIVDISALVGQLRSECECFPLFSQVLLVLFWSGMSSPSTCVLGAQLHLLYTSFTGSGAGAYFFTRATSAH